MDESNRAPQRTRPRPYDLRRKVLLKNFLREQMTHIPLPPPRIAMEAMEEDPDVEREDPLSSVGNEENIEVTNNTQVSVSSSSVTEPIPSTSAQTDEIPLDLHPPKIYDPQQLTNSRLARILKSKMNAVRLKLKIKNIRMKRERMKADRITKAKLKVKSPAQCVYRTSNKTENDNSTKGKKSVFDMFKTRKNKRKEALSLKQEALTSNQVTETKSSTSNQSVQTEASFTQEEFNNMEQSNRCLREENRLLSESLSSFMSDYKFQLSPIKIPYGTDSYITSSGVSPVSNSSQQTSVDVAKQDDSQDKNEPKVKIPRSKSMQERLDKRTPYRSRLRTGSMNYGLSKRFYDSTSLASRDSPASPYRRGYAPDQVQRLSPRRGKYKNSFSTFESYPRQGVSMPTLNVNDRRFPHQASVLKNLPINNSNRTIVRRSSMPERTSYHPARPILRHKSTRVAGYNRRDSYNNEHTVHNFNGNVPIRRRSNVGDYERHVPFQNLPPEAFY